ncbi:glucose-6-phosphate isomerase [Anaerosphaera multitolerans]|uniref:Glucose-6-phosphate isomerase n=1 Tax=Anaerosphaera multitolerans TaxID=2487351 RepID=A0A437S6H5_9FIRM|nr:glucose-6-phosphate isomerase [Anaerosphaera multitolerans]RVU54609.1 glucose-6-phosphate isomerase [Anaerosphaera multitolerans]
MLEFIDDYLNEDTLEKNITLIEKSVDKLLRDYRGFMGWFNPIKSLLNIDEILKVSDDIRKSYDCVLICSIGGSYLGSKAVIDAVKGKTFDLKEEPNLIYIGNSLSGEYLSKVLTFIEKKNPCMVVISKSGNTVETVLSYSVIKSYFKDRFKDYKERIFIVTDEKSGYLRKECKEEGFKSFSVPEDVGGRYSVLTSVGLLPMAIAGLDVKELLRGASDFHSSLMDLKYNENPCFKYSLSRYLLYKEGKTIEILCTYDAKMEYLSKWYVQLFGESEGKSKDAIFPSYLIYTQDLHSMGQYLQEGPGNIFETTIEVVNHNGDIKEAIDGKILDAINNCSMNELNKLLFEAVTLAHRENGVRNLTLQIDRVDEYNLGQVLYFFMCSCALSSVLFGVNPFTQPGVEKYKNILKRLALGENKI